MNLMQIKRINTGNRSIEPHIIQGFFKPENEVGSSHYHSLAVSEHDTNVHPDVKGIFNRLKNHGKTENFKVSS